MHGMGGGKEEGGEAREEGVEGKERGRERGREREREREREEGKEREREKHRDQTTICPTNHYKWESITIIQVEIHTNYKWGPQQLKWGLQGH